MVIAFQGGKLSVKPKELTPPPAVVTRAEKPAEEAQRTAETAPVSPPPVGQPAAPADKEEFVPRPQPGLGALRAYVPPPLPREERAPALPRPSDTSSAPAIASYFSKVDAIHVEGSGDPTAFAEGILGGIQSGDSSQMNKLVNDARVALRQAAAVQPPTPCAEYHRRLIEALSESVAGLEKFSTAVQTSDLASITSVAAQLQTTQQKINDLELMRKQLLGQ